MKAADYCLPIYLNQGAVFDMLAIMEDGLAHVSTIKTAETTKNKGEAGVGATNVFALLGITLKAERAGEANREITQERVHTPVSLFAKVRGTLHAQKLVHDLTTSAVPLEDLKPGNFVEFEVTLRRNPLVEALEAIIETIGAISVMTSWRQTKPTSTVAKGKSKQETDELKPIVEQSKRMLTALKTGGSVDLVGPIAGRPGNVIISVETRYFAENWAEEIGNGRFRVLGKLFRIPWVLRNESASCGIPNSRTWPRRWSRCERPWPQRTRVALRFRRSSSTLAHRRFACYRYRSFCDSSCLRSSNKDRIRRTAGACRIPRAGWLTNAGELGRLCLIRNIAIIQHRS